MLRQANRAVCILGTLSVVGVVACSGGKTDAAPPDPVPSPQPAAVKPAPAEPAAAAPGEPVAAAPPPTDERDLRMWGHYVAALKARDAIISGKLESAREPLGWLASHAYPGAMPEPWRPHTAPMRDAARVALSAPNIEAAARAMGYLASACGHCHAALEDGPPREPTGFTQLGEEDLKARMHRHAWAAERMWDGVVSHWDEAFQEGAKLISEGELEVQTREMKRRDGSLAEVRDIGARALGAGEWGARSAALGDLLVTCANCHGLEGIDLTAAPSDHE